MVLGGLFPHAQKTREVLAAILRIAAAEYPGFLCMGGQVLGTQIPGVGKEPATP